MVHAEITTFSGHRKEDCKFGVNLDYAGKFSLKERKGKRKGRQEREKKGKNKGRQGGKKARLPCKLLSSCKILPT